MQRGSGPETGAEETGGFVEVGAVERAVSAAQEAELQEHGCRMRCLK